MFLAHDSKPCFAYDTTSYPESLEERSTAAYPSWLNGHGSLSNSVRLKFRMKSIWSSNLVSMFWDSSVIGNRCDHQSLSQLCGLKSWVNINHNAKLYFYGLLLYSLWGSILQVVGCLVEHDDKVLLCKRKIEPSYGLWCLSDPFPSS